MDVPGFLKEKIGLFKDFSAGRIKELVDGSTVRSFEAREAIAHQGAEATHFGVVLSGTVVASAITDGTRQALGKLKAGETFGEAALMTGNPMLADFIAESQCEVLLIPVSLFQSMIVAEPRAVRHLLPRGAEAPAEAVADRAEHGEVDARRIGALGERARDGVADAPLARGPPKVVLPVASHCCRKTVVRFPTLA